MNYALSSKWKPGHVVKRDSELGTFVEINSPLQSLAEVQAQRALLSRQSISNLDRLWNQKRG